MKKKQIFTIVNLAALVFVAILWVISVAVPNSLPGFSFAWASLIVTGVWGISYTARVFTEEQAMMKTTWAIVAGIFYLAAAGSLIGALALPDSLVLPIICLAAAIALFVGSLVLGGRKWDEGDNQKPGYKNYFERKAEKEAQKAAEAEASKAEEQPKEEASNE